MSKPVTRRYYEGAPALQPQDCGRRHPQSFCLCVLCEIAARFENIAKLQRSRDLLQALREIDKPAPAKERKEPDYKPPRGYKRVARCVLGVSNPGNLPPRRCVLASGHEPGCSLDPAPGSFISSATWILVPDGGRP